MSLMNKYIDCRRDCKYNGIGYELCFICIIR